MSVTTHNQPLAKPLRSQLEATVKAARDVAEKGAHAALSQLAVGEASAPGYLTDEFRALRRRLRAHGRALGDRKASDDTQALQHLVWEVAYEHWHRMLFARFLAENGLLLWEPGAAVSLDDCEALVQEADPAMNLGAKTKWELAGKLAGRMLPQVFKPQSPVFELAFAPEHQRELERLLAALPPEVFKASDSLGWVYQFWQAKRKDEVNASEVKIGADELPAVTQLFTEPYMVDFLLHNSLGAWWVTRHPGKPCPVPLTYLRLLPSPPGRGVGGEGELRPRRLPLPPEQLEFARDLRRHQTDAETRMWSLVRDRRLADCKFRRQHPLGPYVLDFYCHEQKLAVELDGGQHAEPTEQARDALRTAWLAERGIRVLRFWNNQLLSEPEAVLQEVWDALQEGASLTPTPLPEGEGLEPAAGRFEGWPNRLEDFKLLDPCCGSGHFLVAAFLLLVPMRMAAEGLSAMDAVDAVLADNLHGLELDARCVEIAVFALALAAWRFPDENGDPLGVRADMPAPQVACCGLKVAAKPEDWMALVPDDAANAAYLRQELRLLHASFAQAPLLGSLLDPARSLKNDLATSSFDTLRDLLGRALATERPATLWGQASELQDDSWDLALTAKGLLDAARLLDRRYNLVVTNVPYLARGKHHDTLKDYCEAHYPEAKNDLANVFLERCLELSRDQGAGAVQIVMPQNWLTQSTYRAQREDLLERVTWNLLARLGPGAFETISGEVVQAILLTQTSAVPFQHALLKGVDVSEVASAIGKSEAMRTVPLSNVKQKAQRSNPDSKVLLDALHEAPLLATLADSSEGLSSGDGDRFIFQHWELQFSNATLATWEPLQEAPTEHQPYSGLSNIVRWESGRGPLATFSQARIQGQLGWERHGVLVSEMKSLWACLHIGYKHYKTAGVVIPTGKVSREALFAFCTSDEYLKRVRQVDTSLKVAPKSLVRVPFEVEKWESRGRERFPDGLPKPYSDDPTQWLFHGHPQPATDPLQVAVARLAGYRWPAETDTAMELADEARTWIARCDQLAEHTDDDGIVCLPSVRQEDPAHKRLLNLLIDAWETVQPGSWKPAVLDKLLADADCAGKGLDVWLREKFFEQHAKRFHHRPFIWHVWDGLKDGFAALVNYHQLDHKKLERLIHTYLGDWIRQQEAGVRSGADGAQQRLAAAQDLKRRLELILEGEPPHDIFVRWKPLAEQPIGWNPDLNDGVRLNIRPFMTADVLRHNKKPKLNINWDKDRGKDVESAPWFKTFGGDRINDHHLAVAEKMASKGGGAC